MHVGKALGRRMKKKILTRPPQPEVPASATWTVGQNLCARQHVCINHCGGYQRLGSSPVLCGADGAHFDARIASRGPFLSSRSSITLKEEKPARRRLCRKLSIVSQKDCASLPEKGSSQSDSP